VVLVRRVLVAFAWAGAFTAPVACGQTASTPTDSGAPSDARAPDGPDATGDAGPPGSLDATLDGSPDASPDATLDASDLEAASGDDATGSPSDAGALDEATIVEASIVEASLESGVPFGPCHAIAEQHPIEGANHVPECSYVAYQTLPPSSGNHYPIWGAYKTYTLPLPEGYWVHDLEHGAVVLTYQCDDAGCADEVAAAQQVMDDVADDPICSGTGVNHRLVMTPDPRLDVRFAASAWGWTLRADCFDPVAFGAFIDAHYGQGPEAICSNGADPVGTAGAPAGCGVDP
jgi:hypothetical protein